MTDLILSTGGVPKTLSIFCMGAQEIAFPGCLKQMFFLHFSLVLDSAIIMAMAFDCCVAICLPLRYVTILTPKTAMKIAVGISFWSFCIILPDVFLLTRLPFCRSRIIPHTYCEHIGVACLACADISISVWYGFCVPIMTVISDGPHCDLLHPHPMCCFSPLFQRCMPEGLGHLWFPCLCHPRVLHTCFFLHPCSSFWTQCLPYIPHYFHQSLHCYFISNDPIVYGIKTKQNRDKVILLFFCQEHRRLIYCSAEKAGDFHHPSLLARMKQCGKKKENSIWGKNCL